MLKKIKVNIISDLKKPNLKKTIIMSGFGTSYSDLKFKTFQDLINHTNYSFTDFENITINYIDEERKIYKFSFSLGEVDHCCALLTIGNFQITSNFPENKLIEIIDGLLEIDNEVIIFATNGVGSSIPLEKAILKSKYFKLIRTLKSTDKKRTVKMYISNNDNS